MTTTTNTTEKTVTRKDIIKEAAAMGTTCNASQKLEAVKAAKAETDNAILKCLLDDYAHAMRTTTNAKRLKAAGMSDTDASDYDFKATFFYKIAAAAAAGSRKEEGLKKLNNALFSEWKAYLALIAGEKVSAAASDREYLLNAAMRKGKEAVSYKAGLNKDGEMTASIDIGVSYTGVTTFNAFIREAERLAVERIMGFDGVVSVNDNTKIRENNAALKEAVISEAVAGMAIEARAADATAA